jgi:hypothetical protein
MGMAVLVSVLSKIRRMMSLLVSSMDMWNLLFIWVADEESAALSFPWKAVPVLS